MRSAPDASAVCAPVIARVHRPPALLGREQRIMAGERGMELLAIFSAPMSANHRGHRPGAAHRPPIVAAARPRSGRSAAISTIAYGPRPSRPRVTHAAAPRWSRTAAVSAARAAMLFRRRQAGRVAVAGAAPRSRRRFVAAAGRRELIGRRPDSACRDGRRAAARHQGRRGSRRASGRPAGVGLLGSRNSSLV